MSKYKGTDCRTEKNFKRWASRGRICSKTYTREGERFGEWGSVEEVGRSGRTLCFTKLFHVGGMAWALRSLCSDWGVICGLSMADLYMQKVYLRGDKDGHCGTP